MSNPNAPFVQFSHFSPLAPCVGFISRSLKIERGFPHSSVGKESACNTGDPGLIPGSGRSPGEGKDNPLQYSCLENPTHRGAWQAIVHGVSKVGHELETKPTNQNWKMLRADRTSVTAYFIGFLTCLFSFLLLTFPLLSGSFNWAFRKMVFSFVCLFLNPAFKCLVAEGIFSISNIQCCQNENILF